MTRTGLIEALQHKAAEDAEALWSDARAQAERLKREAAREVAELRVAAAERATAAAQRLEQAATAEALRQARDLRMSAATALAERLYALTRAQLPWLRAEGRDALFESLAAELPAREWQKIRVHPADEPLARRRFPQAMIECDPAIAGGLDAAMEHGRIRVSNTLETRLETAWPDVLPGLIAAILPEVHGHRTPA